MKTICSAGFKISSQDKKAWEHYLLETANAWAVKALAGMINKATKGIFKDYLQMYKDSQSISISTDKATLIQGIINLPQFKSYKREATETKKANRKEVATEEIWAAGFQVEDYELDILNAYYIDPEQALIDIMENKIALRKKALVKEGNNICLNDSSITHIPSIDDDMIDFICSQPGYKNRVQMEAS